MAKRNEATLSQDEVWEEHLENVHVGRHWLYMVGVIGGGFVLMLVLMALVSAGGG